MVKHTQQSTLYIRAAAAVTFLGRCGVQIFNRQHMFISAYKNLLFSYQLLQFDTLKRVK